MKKYFVVFTLLVASTICSFGQTDQLYISVVQPERSEISAEAGKQLERKMTQLLTANGISSQDANNRFVITAKVDITSKDIVASTPQRISEKIDLTFLVGDVVENKVFETITLPLIGIGINENKAFIAAINQVKPQKAELSEFLNRAKNKIVEYYSVRCTQIIKQAQKLASGNEYDEAIYQLMQVPDICDCAKQCQDLMIEYTVLHLHSMDSNPKSGLTIDSITPFEAYAYKAKEDGMKAIAYTEHGSVLHNVAKKQLCKKLGIKYIHGQEFYVTEKIDPDNLVRDNYHCILLAKNKDGVMEINYLSSIANNRDGHFFYTPRITLDELLGTSDNILILTACVAGILCRGTSEAKERFLTFVINNKHRCWLEIQPHNFYAQPFVAWVWSMVIT